MVRPTRAHALLVLTATLAVAPTFQAVPAQTAAPAAAGSYPGAGTSMVHLDPVHDLVVVALCIQGGATDDFIEHVLAAIEDPAASEDHD